MRRISLLGAGNVSKPQVVEAKWETARRYTRGRTCVVKSNDKPAYYSIRLRGVYN
jgi:hypothetical protein